MLGILGSDPCPTGYTCIIDSGTCEHASTALGLDYIQKTKDEIPDDPVCIRKCCKCQVRKKNGLVVEKKCQPPTARIAKQSDEANCICQKTSEEGKKTQNHQYTEPS